MNASHMTALTPAQESQIAYCRHLLRQGVNPQDMRDIGYSQGAIDAAIDAEKQTP